MFPADNQVVISSEVKAAEEVKWSTALVYTGFSPDFASAYGYQDYQSAGISWSLLNKPNWVFITANSIATTGEVLNYQFMEPIGLTTKAGPRHKGYIYSDDNDTTRFEVFTTAALKKNLWEYTKEEFTQLASGGVTPVACNTYYDVADEGTYYRVTYNCVSYNGEGEYTYGYETAIQVKATGAVYGARAHQTQLVYNDTLCRTLVYSFMPTVLQ